MRERLTEGVTRAVAPAVGLLLIVVCTVALGAVVASLALSVEPVEPGPNVRISVEATAEDGTVSVTHEGGETIDVSEIEMRIDVDGTPLTHQPPVPFFSAKGFYGGPTGPFNDATDPTWEAGETATVKVAGTNDPTPAAGSTVTVRLYRNGVPIATAETRAR